VHVLEHRHLIARPGRLAEIKLHDPPLLGRLDFFDLLESLDAALHLRGLRGVGGEAVDESLLLRKHRLLPCVRRFLIGVANGALALVEVVVA